MSQHQHQFLWFDLETTGLRADAGVILEFAAVLCEDDHDGDFAIVQSYTGVIHHAATDLAALQILDPVTRMHAHSGLWLDVDTSTTTIEEVDAFLESLAESLAPGRHHAISLAGYGVFFDLAWSRVHLPRFADRLSHRVFDVSTLIAAARSWGPGFTPTPDADKAHRALPDVMRSIEQAIELRALMGWAAAQ